MVRSRPREWPTLWPRSTRGIFLSGSISLAIDPGQSPALRRCRSAASRMAEMPSPLWYWEWTVPDADMADIRRRGSVAVKYLRSVTVARSPFSAWSRRAWVSSSRRKAWSRASVGRTARLGPARGARISWQPRRRATRTSCNFFEAAQRIPLGEPDHWIKVPDRVSPNCGVLNHVSRFASSQKNSHLTSGDREVILDGTQ